MKGRKAVDGSDTDRTRDEAVVRAGRRAGKPLREIAVELYGRERVEACWHADGAMRAAVRRAGGEAGRRTDRCRTEDGRR